MKEMHSPFDRKKALEDHANAMALIRAMRDKGRTGWDILEELRHRGSCRVDHAGNVRSWSIGTVYAAMRDDLSQPAEL